MTRIRTFNPATIIAIVALFFSLTGTAVAGALITGANVKNGTIGGIDLTDNSVGTVDVKNGTLLPVDFKPGKLPTGPQGEQGPQGPQGEQGLQGVAGLSGVEVVSNASASNPSDNKGVSATCPAGKRPVGGGATVFATLIFPKEITIVASYPTATGWNAYARELVAYGASWRVTAYAICANVAA